MSDLISRQALLKKSWDADTRCGYVQVVDVGDIMDAPSVQPISRWILVSERLPKDRKPVLVTAYWHETYQVMVGSYFGNGDWWCAPWNNTGEPQQLLKVKAWMPLPKAYESEERTDESL